MLNDLFPVGGLVVGLFTIAAGVIILIWPKILPYIIGIYLIIVGLGTVIVALR